MYTEMSAMTQYSVKKAYAYDHRTGSEKVIWHIVYGDEVVDACNLRRDAKFWCDKWNIQLAEDTQQTETK